MPDIDFFYFFRLALGTVVTIYATIVTVQSLWQWYLWLSTGERYVTVLRRYLIVHGLRLRFRAFWGDVLLCVLLSVAFVLLWRAHAVVEGMREARRPMAAWSKGEKAAKAAGGISGE